MKKKIGVLFIVFTLFTTSMNPVAAADYSYVGGNGYQQYRTAPNLSIGIALSAVALAAVIGLAVTNISAGHATDITD